VSYDIEVKDDSEACPTCGHYSGRYEANITTNVREMMDLAGANFWDLQKLKGDALCEKVSEVLAFLIDEANAEALREVEPSNGWGTLEQLREFMLHLWIEVDALDDPRLHVEA